MKKIIQTNHPTYLVGALTDVEFGKGDFTIDFWVKFRELKPKFKNKLEEALHNL